MRKLFLGKPPEIKFNPSSVEDAIKSSYTKGLKLFFNDSELMILLARCDDQEKVVQLFRSIVWPYFLPLLKGVLENIDHFDVKFIEESLMAQYVMKSAGRGDKEVALTLLNHPKRSRGNRHLLQFRLLQRYAYSSYVTDDFLSAISSSPVFHTHLKYYLPSETLHKIFPDPNEWTSDLFLQEVDRSDKNKANFKGHTLEREFMVMFFDKSAGLFGDAKFEGGNLLNDKQFIRMVEEQQPPLPWSDQLETLKKHLRQVAEMAEMADIYFDPDLKPRFHDLLREKLKGLPVNDTYLFTVHSSGHTGYALATKTDDSHLNVKVFNSYHDLVYSDDRQKIWPYIEWDGLVLEEVLSKDFTSFDNDSFAFSDTIPARPPQNLPAHMKVKGQRIGTCPAFKFWLIARHDLETLPRFLEFSVALHLSFIETFDQYYEAVMQRLDAKIRRGWFAITHTPHFEGQLLKDIEDINGDVGMYRKLRNQIIQSVQRRYRKHYPQLCNWDDEKEVIEFIPWKEKFLAAIPNDYNGNEKKE